jgi:hypothetical protein
MSASDEALAQDTLPRIDLRLPTPWSSPSEFVAALYRNASHYELTDDALVHVSTGNRFEWSVSDPDNEIAGLFADGGRCTDKEIAAIERHRCKFHISYRGGSVSTARAIFDAATALVHAGALGVMVDNSGNAHASSDWLKLAADTSPGGLYWAYVSTTKMTDVMFTMGMHCLGLRDAELPYAPDTEMSARIIHNFLGYTYQSGETVLDGEELGDEDGPLFSAHHQPCTRFEVGTPFYNPYGVWRIEPIDKEPFDE